LLSLSPSKIKRLKPIQSRRFDQKPRRIPGVWNSGQRREQRQHVIASRR
jgi:hypothetical protein